MQKIHAREELQSAIGRQKRNLAIKGPMREADYSRECLGVRILEECGHEGISSLGRLVSFTDKRLECCGLGVQCPRRQRLGR